MKVLILGGNGQLGQCFKSITKNTDFIFADIDEVDITLYKSIDNYIKQYPEGTIYAIVNCAAYTNVDESEDNYEKAHAINTLGVKNVVDICKKYDIRLIHISTDFVFNGKSNIPYSEDSDCNPINVYGETKYLGEKYVLEHEKAIVIRTSWLYSEYCKNFYLTIKNRILSGIGTTVVNDQIGTPTYAKDLACFIIKIITIWQYSENKFYQNLPTTGNDYIYKNLCSGIFHFSNEGICSWYDFAKAIEVLINQRYNKHYDHIYPCISNEYKTKAERPKYSVLSKERIKSGGFKVRHWLEALAECVENDKFLFENKKSEL